MFVRLISYESAVHVDCVFAWLISCHHCRIECHIIIAECHAIIGECHVIIAECHAIIVESRSSILAVITLHRDEYYNYTDDLPDEHPLESDDDDNEEGVEEQPDLIDMPPDTSREDVDWKKFLLVTGKAGTGERCIAYQKPSTKR